MKLLRRDLNGGGGVGLIWRVRQKGLIRLVPLPGFLKNGIDDVMLTFAGVNKVALCMFHPGSAFCILQQPLRGFFSNSLRSMIERRTDALWPEE